MSDLAERLFCQRTSKSLDLWRAGWPDYLAKHRRSGQLIGIEVKRGKGKISPSQARMFGALEARLPIFIWNPKTPRRLIPWRDYHQQKSSAKNYLPLDVVREPLPGEVHGFTPASDRRIRSSRKFTLTQLRKQQRITQETLAKRAKITQGEVSRTEQRKDCLVSTLARYIAALDGELLIRVELDGALYTITL